MSDWTVQRIEQLAPDAAANVGVDFAVGENWLVSLDICYLDIE